MSLFTHPNMRDIAFQVLRVKKANETFYRVKVAYFIRLPESKIEYEPMGVVDTLILKKSKISEWIRIENR